jgi:hypothetical protein
MSAAPAAFPAGVVLFRAVAPSDSLEEIDNGNDALSVAANMP